MDENYKEHQINTTARQLPESGRWIPHVIIRWSNGAHCEEFIQFDVKRGFANEGDAQVESLIAAKKWIDERKGHPSISAPK
jgi:hypothetical protein